MRKALPRATWKILAILSALSLRGQLATMTIEAATDGDIFQATSGMVRVRRERRLVHSGCKSHPGTGSFHPVAIETAAEATKRSELSMKRVARRLRERAGHNVSER